MTVELAAGIGLIVVPVAFNVTFTLLARSFRYPEILRRPAAEVLTSFAAGGTRLVLLWWAFALTAALMIPLAVLVGHVLGGPGNVLAALSVVLGVIAGLVQTLGLMRWPFAVALLARRYVDPSTTDAQRGSIDIVFDALHRYLGVAIGEHLGYLFTGSWTVISAVAMLGSNAFPSWVGWIGIPIGVLQLLGSLEFVGPNEPGGWAFADRAIPIAYIGWSLWLVLAGMVLLIG